MHSWRKRRSHFCGLPLLVFARAYLQVGTWMRCWFAAALHRASSNGQPNYGRHYPTRPQHRVNTSWNKPRWLHRRCNPRWLHLRIPRWLQRLFWKGSALRRRNNKVASGLIKNWSVTDQFDERSKAVSDKLLKSSAWINTTLQGLSNF